MPARTLLSRASALLRRLPSAPGAALSLRRVPEMCAHACHAQIWAMAMPESSSWALQEDQSTHLGVVGLRGRQPLTPGPGECTLCHHMVYLAVRSNLGPVTLPWGSAGAAMVCGPRATPVTRPSTSNGQAQLNPAAAHNCATAGQPGRACLWLIHQPALRALEGWLAVQSWRCTALTSRSCTAPCVLLYCGSGLLAAAAVQANSPS